MASVERTGDGVRVTLTDGREVDGSHCLLALGSIPNTEGLGLEEAGVELDDAGFIDGRPGLPHVDLRGIYAAGDCTGVLMLASVAAQQGRIAMSHLLGDAVHPLDLTRSPATSSPRPRSRPSACPRASSRRTASSTASTMLPLASNPRAKMQGIRDGFVKLFARETSGDRHRRRRRRPAGQRAHPRVSLAVSASLTVDQVADAFTVYPSLSGSVAEAARRLHRHL